MSVWERLTARLRGGESETERPVHSVDTAFFERLRSRWEQATQAVEVLEAELAEAPSRASDRVEQLLDELRRQRWVAEGAEWQLSWESARELAYARIWNMQQPEVDERGWCR